MSEGGDVDDVGVRGMDADAGHRLGIAKSHVTPGLAAVGRFVDAVPLGDAAAKLCLAASYIDDIGVGLGHRDGADGGARDLAVGHGKPGVSSIGRFPQPSPGGAKVVLVHAAGTARTPERAPPSLGADVSPFERGKPIGAELNLLRGEGGCEDGRENDESGR